MKVRVSGPQPFHLPTQQHQPAMTSHWVVAQCTLTSLRLWTHLCQAQLRKKAWGCHQELKKNRLAWANRTDRFWQYTQRDSSAAEIPTCTYTRWWQLFLNRCLKVMKTQLPALQLCVWLTKLKHIAMVCIISWANLFLLFIGKEWINMAAPWGAQIQRKKKKKYVI